MGRLQSRERAQEVRVSGVIFAFDSFTFDPELRTLTRDGNTVTVSPKVADLLEQFVLAPGEVLSKNKLLTTVWADAFVEEGTLTFHIHALRQALNENAAKSTFIQTVQRRGYRFIAPVHSFAREPIVPVTSGTPGSPQISAVFDRVGGDAHDEPHTPTAPSIAAVLDESERKPSLIQRSLGGKTALIVFMSVFTVLLVVVSFGQGQNAQALRVTAIRRLTFDESAKGPRVLELSNGRPLIEIGVHQFVLSGGGHLLPSPFEPFLLLDISARGGALAIRPNDPGAERGLWILPLNGGKPKRVGQVQSNVASWSHDGHWIAFTDVHSLYVTDDSGAAVRRLASFSGGAGWPVWSPNDQGIRVPVHVQSDSRVWVGLMDVPLNGSESHEVVQNPEDDTIGNGGWLTGSDYLVCGKRTSAGCLAMTLRAGIGAAMPDNPISPIRFDALMPSSDGRRVYGTVRMASQLSRYDSDHQTFVPYLGGIDAFAVDYSRDGNWMVYITDSDHRLWRADPDGQDARRLTAGSFHVDAAAIAPDGKTIAVRGAFDDQRMKIYLVPAVGGPPAPIVSEDVEQGSPTWSPDGTRIAFGDVPEMYGFPTGNERLHIFDLHSRRIEDVPQSEGLWSSRWSPDGRYLAATTIAQRSLRLFDFGTRIWRAYDVDHVDNMSWSRDGRYLYCYPESANPWRRIAVPEGTVDMERDVDALGVSNGGLARDGSALFLVSRSDVYELDVAPEGCSIFRLISGCLD